MPKVQQVRIDSIPPDLVSPVRWVCWRYEWRDGKNGKPGGWTKVLYNARTLKRAKSNDPTTWSTFDEALQTYQNKGGFDGIGYVIAADGGIVGVDIDKCLDEDGRPYEWARPMLEALKPSYGEVSPSGRGVKFLVRSARLPTEDSKSGANFRPLPAEWKAAVGAGVELYHDRKFFALTGNLLPGCDSKLVERGDFARSLFLKLKSHRDGRKSSAPSSAAQLPRPVMADDEAILAKARTARNGADFQRLWRGDVSRYPSASEADLALCCMLVFWAGPDKDRIDRLFRQSALVRDKWTNREDYRRSTIESAINSCHEFYRWNGNGRTNTTVENAKKERASVVPPAAPGQANRVGVITERNEEEEPWPEPLDIAAYHGLVGGLVRAIEPHSESDPAALLIQMLAAFGNVIGRAAYFEVEGSRHHSNIYACLGGSTSKGRKGSSWSQCAKVFSVIDEDWFNNRLAGGLSSGEGLIWAVRDPIKKAQKVSQKGAGKGKAREEVYEEVEVDSGVRDKRLFVVEQEFGGCLKVMSRDRNTLSAIIRQAWDTGMLRIMTKNSPASATGSHISIIGHITRDELRRQLHDTEMVNGFANRFLWLCCKRSKCLPEGGNLRGVDLEPLTRQLTGAIEFGRNMGEMRRDDEARAVWAEVYPQLSDAKPGLLGAATSRAESQVMRLAMIYALLDCSASIRLPHLEAALALWDYCERSARYLFGSGLGDSTADELLRLLRRCPHGVTKTEMTKHFGNNKKADEINDALTVLARNGLARAVRERSSSGKGRDVERWFSQG